MHRGKITSIFSSNSEAFASELLEKIEVSLKLQQHTFNVTRCDRDNELYTCINPLRTGNCYDIVHTDISG